MTASNSRPAALARVEVVEIGTLIAGPARRALAQLGSDVIKIESRRRWG